MGKKAQTVRRWWKVREEIGWEQGARGSDSTVEGTNGKSMMESWRREQLER